MTPGDQDFALGESFLIELSKKVKFKFLISNASQKLKLEHEELIHIDANGLDLFFIGVTDPSLFNNNNKDFFTNPTEAIKKQVDIIEKKYKSKNKKIILVSHAGIDSDRKFAKVIKQIDWIIGAHSQSYLRFSEDVGNTQLVQVLSRNHYIGKIFMPLDSKAKETYEIVEARDETKDLVKLNPMVSWLDNFKTKLDQIQLEEQRKATVGINDFAHLKTAKSCFECHQKQGEFWQTTSHSLAFKTLIDAKSANNSTCIECHSVGFKEREGFLVSDKIVLSENKNFDIEKYWNEFNSKVIKTNESIRSLSSTQRKAHSQVR